MPLVVGMARYFRQISSSSAPSCTALSIHLSGGPGGLAMQSMVSRPFLAQILEIPGPSHSRPEIPSNWDNNGLGSQISPCQCDDSHSQGHLDNPPSSPGYPVHMKSQYL